MPAGVAGISIGRPYGGGSAGGPTYNPFLGQWVSPDSGPAPQQQQQTFAPAPEPAPQSNVNPGMQGLIPPPAPVDPGPAPAAPVAPTPEAPQTPIPMPQSMQSLGSQPIPAPDSSLNPNLGRRIYPQSMQALAQMAGRNY